MARGKIAIAGAGIAGMTCALYLARYGYNVNLFEAAPALSEVGAGLQLSPNAVACLAQLGLQEPLEEVAIKPDSIDVFTAATGRKLTAIPLGNYASKRYAAPYYVIHRADLQTLLATAVNECANITTHLNSSVVSANIEGEKLSLNLEPTCNKRELANGLLETKGTTTAEFDLLLAANGVWSSLRKQLQLPPAKYSGRVAYRATIGASHLPANMRQNTGLWLGHKAHLVHYPVSAGTQLNIVAIVHEDWQQQDWSHQTTIDNLLPHFKNWSPKITRYLTEAHCWTRWALCHILPGDCWSKGRIALLGDAAHAMTPFMAQGAGMAIEDAAVLAQQIGKFGATPVALTAYANERRERAEKVAKTALANERIYHLPAPLSLGRNMVMRTTPPSILLGKYDWIYNWTPPPLPPEAQNGTH
ncbi:FAD-dependent monooxygenase [Polycladidibacter stylochi]|uniref:FAD-dependent monooxygenase n=1 Tax=Polycladidibacter stylochi TaxID=1807766 RepID=UPI000AC66EAA|nr:FAD-dependent monooxygenase [Pseudovibrio stylochi]